MSEEAGAKYWGNVLNAFEAGVQLDLRVRMASDFLKSPYFEKAFDKVPLEAIGISDAERMKHMATLALDLATGLLDEAAARGLLKDMPDTGEISGPMKRHIERNVAAQAHQVETQQREGRRINGGVALPGMQ